MFTIHPRIQAAARALLGAKGPINTIDAAQPFVSLGGFPLQRLPALEVGDAIPRRFIGARTAGAVVAEFSGVGIRVSANQNVLIHVQRIVLLPGSGAANINIGLRVSAGVNSDANGDAIYTDSRLPAVELVGGPVDIFSYSEAASQLDGKLVYQIGAAAVVNCIDIPCDFVLVPTGKMPAGGTNQAHLLVECGSTNQALGASFEGVLYEFPTP